jgi:flagellar motor switch protein FliM
MSYHRPRSPVEARRRIEKRLLEAAFEVELFAPDLTVPLRSLADLKPGTLLTFPKSISAPAVLIVDQMSLCPAMPARVSSRRAACVIAEELGPPPQGEL